MAEQISVFLAHYGYVAIFCVVAIESAGIPFPGETILLSAAILSGNSHSFGRESLTISGIVAAAAGGAIMGDNIGFWVGRTLGFELLVRYGQRVRLDVGRLKLGQYLFREYGGAVVFFGRFVAVLRAFAAFLAGANRMDPWRFFMFNAAGGVVWASVFGGLGFFFGSEAHRIASPIGIFGLVSAIVIFAFCVRFYKRNEIRLIAEAEAAMPGPLIG